MKKEFDSLLQQNVFDASQYSATQFSYDFKNYNSLNFCYIVSKDFLSFFTLTHINKHLNSFQNQFSEKQRLNRDIVKQHKEHSSLPEFRDFNTTLSKNYAKHVQCVSRECWSFIEKLHPRALRIRRVLFHNQQRIQYEMFLKKLKVFVADVRDLGNGEISSRNYKDRVFRLRLSRFCSRQDLMRLVSAKVGDSDVDFERRDEKGNVNIYVPQQTKFEKKQFVMLKQGVLPVSAFESLRSFNFQKTLILFYKSEFDDWIQMGSPGLQNSCEICRQTLEPGNSMKLCSCGKMFCDAVCLQRHPSQDCQT